MGRYVTAGDRFESFRPGYQAVKDQLSVSRYELRVLSAGVTPDNRTLVLQTAPRTEAMNYAVALPEIGRAERPCDDSRHEQPQQAAIDVLADLTGVEAAWRSADGKETWTGWLPHLDLAVARGFTTDSVEQARLFELLQKPGTLTLRAQLDLWQMLHPAVQPGAKLDFEYPPETITVALKAQGKLEVKTTAKIQRLGSREARITVEGRQDHWLPLELTLATGAAEPRLGISWSTAEDPRSRAFPLRRILLPWAKPASSQTAAPVSREIPELAGGDWERGRKIFFSEPAICFKCHQAAGEGGKIGPDLSNLVYRDYASVLRDIRQPSAAINPDHLAYSIELKDGDSVTGVILEDGPESIVVGQGTGQSLTVPRSRIASVKASSVSLMPEGLLQALDAQQQKDLLTFLLTEPPNKTKN